MNTRLCCCLVLNVVLPFPILAAEGPQLDSHLEPLRPFLEKTWKGNFKNSTLEKPVVDVARWERALNGKAVRILHSINGGSYGGESIVMWNEKKQTVCYDYFTTAGFKTSGTMTFTNGKVLTRELVEGSSSGIREVRGTTEIPSDGSFVVTTEHRIDGEWMPGRETTYRVDSTANVVFR